MKKQDQAINDLLKQRPFIIDKRGAFKGLLSDVYFDDKAYVTQLDIAYGLGFAFKIITDSSSNAEKRMQLSLLFEQSTGYSQEIAKKVVDSWLSWLSPDVIIAYKTYKEEIQNEPPNETPETIPTKKSASTHKHTLKKGEIFFPCAIGKNGSGFVISGIKQKNSPAIKHESIYAITYNYLLRSDSIDEIKDLPQYIACRKKSDLKFDPDYTTVFRLMILALSLVKEGYAKDGKVAFDYDGNDEELSLAFDCINDYLSIFSKIARINDNVNLKYAHNAKLKVSFSDIGANILIFDCDIDTNSRQMWHAQNLLYHITQDQKEPLLRILHEMSPYRDFNPGQFEAFVSMINSAAHSICIMPTGSGKSLIYYMMAILQPSAMFVVSPTQILIDDQIANLHSTHKFDNVVRLELNDEFSFSEFQLSNHLIYLTPEVFQNRDLLKRFVLWNQSKSISAIVLDEVHCLSNWSHDFRPEYLMLSRQLNEFLDRTYLKGFTATANYSVMKDISKQLSISYEYIFSPIELKKNNLRFSFKACDTYKEMVDSTSECLKESIKKGRKVLVFTKNVHVSELLQAGFDEDVQYETTVYSENDKVSYRSFANGEFRVLITTDDLGVGINLSDVQVVIHFGLPISKGEYVQQIGRAGRHGEAAYSYVFYLNCYAVNTEEAFLHRTSDAASIMRALENQQINNDYSDTYRKLLGDAVYPEVFSSSLSDTYEKVKGIDSFEEIEFNNSDLSLTKKCLYILFSIGYLKNWSMCSNNVIGVCKNPDTDLSNLKERFRNYLYNIGESKKSIHKVGTSKSLEDLLDVYIDWYYSYFIYFHKEQFLEVLSFFENYSLQQGDPNSNRVIADKLASYFSLRMLEISEDEAKYATLTYKNIVDSVKPGVEYSTRANIEKLNDNRWNPKFEWFIIIFDLINDDSINTDRLSRVADSISEADVLDWIESISLIYSMVSKENRLELLSVIERVSCEQNLNFCVCFDSIYRNNPKDIIYYGVMASRINTVMGDF